MSCVPTRPACPFVSQGTAGGRGEGPGPRRQRRGLTEVPPAPAQTRRTVLHQLHPPGRQGTHNRLDQLRVLFMAGPGLAGRMASGRAINWIARRTSADADTLWAIEGAPRPTGRSWPEQWTPMVIRWLRHQAWMPRNAAAWGEPTPWTPTRSRPQRCRCPWRSCAAPSSMKGSA